MSDVVAAFDCGTNTIKMLIGALPEVAVRESRIVRLGQGVDARRDELDIHLAHAEHLADLGRAWAALAYLMPTGTQP